MAEQHSAVVGNLTMRWLEVGEGDTVVFIHGIPTGTELWRHVLPRLDGARKLAWEMVGYGGSMAASAGADLSVVARPTTCWRGWRQSASAGPSSSATISAAVWPRSPRCGRRRAAPAWSW